MTGPGCDNFQTDQFLSAKNFLSEREHELGR